MGGIQLRRLTTADTGLLRAATHTNMNWRGPELFDFRQIDTELHFSHYFAFQPARGDFGFVAESAGHAVGVVWCLFLDADQPGYGYVGDGVPELSLCVWSGYRGLGLGRRLLDRALDTARDGGVRRVSLSVESDNTRALGLYRRHGFRRAPEAIDDGTYVLDFPEPASRPAQE